MTPFYPALLAGIFRVFGAYSFPAFVTAAGVNILASTLTCIPVFLAGKRIAGASVAAGAAWLWAIFPPAVTMPYESMWDASIAAFLAATILWATVAVAESPRTRDWYAYGLLWGVALMTSATLASFLPFLFGWLAWRARREPLRHFATAAVVVVLCCVPWTVRNYATFHTLVPLRSVMGLSLWVGNNDRADGISPGGAHPISNATERARYVELGEMAYMEEKREQALQFIAAHPGRFAALTANRFIAIWAGGTPHPFNDFRRARSVWFRWSLLFNLAGALGGAAGIAILYRRRSRYALPVAAIPLIYPLAYYITLAPARYRLPMDPVLLLLTAISLQAICQTIKSGPGKTGPRIFESLQDTK